MMARRRARKALDAKNLGNIPVQTPVQTPPLKGKSSGANRGAKNKNSSMAGLSGDLNNAGEYGLHAATGSKTDDSDTDS